MFSHGTRPERAGLFAFWDWKSAVQSDMIRKKKYKIPAVKAFHRERTPGTGKGAQTEWIIPTLRREKNMG